MGILKNFDTDINLVWDNVKKELQKRNRNPEIYIIPYKDYKINKEFKLLYTDVWMVESDLENFNKYKSKIDVDFGIVPDNLKESFVKAVMDGFSGEDPEDPYEAVNDGYGTALYNSFQNLESEYKSIHYKLLHFLLYIQLLQLILFPYYIFQHNVYFYIHFLNL